MARSRKKTSSNSSETEDDTKKDGLDPAETGETEQAESKDAAGRTEIEDAEVVEETPPATDAAPDTGATTDSEPATEDENSGAASEEPSADEPDEKRVEDPSDQGADGDSAALVVPLEPPRRSGAALAIPLVLGGLLAGGIGFLAGQATDIFAKAPEGPTPQENAAEIATLSSKLGAQGGDIAALSAVDTPAVVRAELESGLGPVRGDIDALKTRIADVQTQLEDLSVRVETIAMRPVATGVEVSEFDGALSEFRNKLNAAIESAQGEIDKAQSEAKRISQEAFSAEQSAAARGAWAQVTTALDTGAAFADPLNAVADITKIKMPEALTAVSASGVPTVADLQNSFPDFARTALQASVRAEKKDAPLERLTSFLRVQAGVRSLAPREGSDPDAILSRAEAAVRSGALGTALEELAALPEPGRKAMADWESAVRTRDAAVAAAASISEQLNAN